MKRATLLTTDKLTLRTGAASLLTDLDWQVHQGEFWCVLGKNGIGKSTLLHTVAGLLAPASGHRHATDGDVAGLTPRQLALWRGLVAQQQFDAFSCNVLDSVMAGLHPYRTGWGWHDAADRRAAADVLGLLGMTAYADADVMRLSGGERQRVAIATLLLQAPQLYLLDEPASHQDVAAQQVVMRLLRELADDEHGVVASMHDINLAARFATHVLLIGERSWWSGEVNEVLRPDVLQAAFDCRFDVIDSARGKWFAPSSA
ncbi:ABC transporter ATP-binding protein [Herbaspirillum sp. RV1423]|uniref:ABC transporter ATP-binding protein n=1 Tax=Herbaspirillum sp. RV1423 TaxID=1443993 RepID=UPI0004B32D6A|nr:ABC transporter ATP-binding protein [Herbaspirillum sp. RV1423]